jgi:hypothetical protein
VHVGAALTWRTEERASDGTRTDLECWWGEPQRPWLVIEAKLDALLSAEPLTGYINDQAQRIGAESGVALFAVLAPAHRRSEAESVLKRQ